MIKNLRVIACNLVVTLATVTAAAVSFPAASQDGSFTQRPPRNSESVNAGRTIYDRACIFCHGKGGQGDGPVAYFLSRDTGPHPRDFTSGIYKLRSTPSGELPSDEDLYRSISNGIPGFMPPFRGLADADRWRLVYYIQSLYPDFAGNETIYLPIVGSPVPESGASVHRGYEIYQELKCWECHGGGGRGDGEKAADLKDDWGFHLPSRNLTRPSSFKNGQQPEDLYRSIMGGLDGGAMPAYADFLEGAEEDAWHLINYIRSLSTE